MNDNNYIPQKQSEGFVIDIIAPNDEQTIGGVFLASVPPKGKAYLIVHPDDFELIKTKELMQLMQLK